MRDGVPLEAFTELQRAAEALAHHLQSAQKAAAAAQGKDQTGRVLVTLNGDARVRHIRLERDWRRSLAAADLGVAILTAYDRATEDHLARWAAAVALPMGTDDPSGETGPAAGHPRVTPMAFDLEAVAETWDHLRESSHRIDEIERQLTECDAATVSAQDPGRHVTVTLIDGRVQSVQFDQRWLARAGSGEIGERTTGAIAAAYALHDNRAGETARSCGLAIDIDSIRMLARMGFSLPVSW